MDRDPAERHEELSRLRDELGTTRESRKAAQKQLEQHAWDCQVLVTKTVSARGNGSKKALILADGSIARFIGTMLEEMGVKICMAKDQDDALAKLKGNGFAAVVAVLNKNAQSVASIIRKASGLCRHCIVISVKDGVRKDAQERLDDLGVTLLQHPVEPQDLAEIFAT